MRPIALGLLVVAIGAAGSLSFGDERLPVVEIGLYPYYHDPAPAWKVSILADGTVRYEESASPMKAVVTRDDSTSWIQRPSRSPSHLSHAKQKKLLADLRALDLGSLEPHYSAEYSFSDPTAETRVTTDSGQSYTTPAEVTRIVTHGATYRLHVALDDASTDSFVYAPFEALEQEAPGHPDRAAIARVLAGWYYVLKAIGPVNGFKARMFRPTSE